MEKGVQGNTFCLVEIFAPFVCVANAIVCIGRMVHLVSGQMEAEDVNIFLPPYHFYG